MLDQIIRINLLFDIYGSLLTARQQEILQLYFSDDYSLGEIAAEYQISRQAVHDLIRRSIASLENFESKLGFYEQYRKQQELLSEAELLLKNNKLDKKETVELINILKELRSITEQ